MSVALADKWELALYDRAPYAGGSEITGDGYARVVVGECAEVVSHSIAEEQVTLPRARADWGTATYIRVFVNGDPWDSAPLATPLTVSAGQSRSLRVRMHYVPAEEMA